MAPEREGSANNGKELSARQMNMAACLAVGMTKADACRKTKVGMSTLYQWLKQPAFRDKIDELRREVVDRAIGRLADLMSGKAIDVLTARLDRTDPDTGEVAASLDDVKAAFDLFGGLKSNTELQAKLDKLLEAMGEGGKR
jgi:hypothetical protein